MKLNSVFGGDSLKAEDIQGHEPTVIIETVQIKKFDDGPKLVLTFEGKKKSLICNKTNANIIEEIYGDETDDWPGNRITLYVARVDFQGKRVPAIRVRDRDWMMRREQTPANGGPRENKVPNIPGRISTHEVEDKGRYDTLRRTEPVKNTDADLPTDSEIPF